jgi:hypothetical protein
MVTLAALPEGDHLSFTSLQDLAGLTPGNLITHLRKLDHGGYVRTDKNRRRAQRADHAVSYPGRPGRAGPVHHRAAADPGRGRASSAALTQLPGQLPGRHRPSRSNGRG